jgi:hypothetical protein
MRQDGPRQGRIHRPSRPTGFGQNPLRRCSDRIQAIVWAGLVTVFLIGAPLASIYASHEIYIYALWARRAQAMTWHRVPALVLHAKPLVTALETTDRPPTLLVLRWVKSDGSPQTGEVTRAGNAVAGSNVIVWTDKKGRLAHPPLSRAEVADRAICAAVAAPMALGLLLAAVGGVVSFVLDRHRLAHWSAEWEVVGPQWTGRR